MNTCRQAGARVLHHRQLHVLAAGWEGACAPSMGWIWPSHSRHTSTAGIQASSPPASFSYYEQKGASWLFPKTRGFDEGGFAAVPDDEPAAAPDPDPEAVPYRPAPLRFLRRNKTAPVPGAGSLCPSSSTGDCGGSGAAAGIGVPAAGGWGHLMVAGGVGGTGAAARQAQQAQQAAPQPLACFTVAASAVPPAAVGQQQQQQQHVHRNINWPVYNNPLASLPPSEPSCGSLAMTMRPPQPAAVAVELPSAAVTVAVAGAAQQGPRPPSPPHSHTSTPQDSAQDLEAGTAGGPDKSSGSLPSKASTSKAGGSSKAGGGTTSAAAAALPAGPVFGALQYRLPGAPPTGPGSGDTTPEPRGEFA